MIRSMTGFGRGEFADETSRVTVEIRTVNHRYLDIFVKMPRKYSFAEEAIKAAVKEKLYRGKAEVNVTVDNIGQSDSDVKLDGELAAKYYDALSALKDSFDFGDLITPISLRQAEPEETFTTPARGFEDRDTGAARDLTVILELDRTQLGRAVYRLNKEETHRVGVNLAGVYE